MLGNFFKYFFLSKDAKTSLFPHKYFADISSECQTIWISDEAPHFVGLHLDPNCLHGHQRSSKFTPSGLRVNATVDPDERLHQGLEGCET